MRQARPLASHPGLSRPSAVKRPLVELDASRQQTELTGLSLVRRLTLGFYILLAGCSTTPVAVCPAVVPYTPEQQIQVADELETLPPDAMTRTFIRDYGIERAKLRACHE